MSTADAAEAEVDQHQPESRLDRERLAAVNAYVEVLLAEDVLPHAFVSQLHRDDFPEGAEFDGVYSRYSARTRDGLRRVKVETMAGQGQTAGVLRQYGPDGKLASKGPYGHLVIKSWRYLPGMKFWAAGGVTVTDIDTLTGDVEVFRADRPGSPFHVDVDEVLSTVLTSLPFESKVASRIPQALIDANARVTERTKAQGQAPQPPVDAGVPVGRAEVHGRANGDK
jgi:hypothetical protein